MPTVNSVLGPIDTANLGFTLSHEHVLVTSAGIQYVYPEFIDREGTIARGVADLTQAYGEGLRTIIDVTTIDLGRDIRMLEQVSRESGVNIICATGTWRDIPRVFWTADPDMIAPLYIREIEEGIEGTGIRAAVSRARSFYGRRPGHRRRRAFRSRPTPTPPSAWESSRSPSSRTRAST